MIPIAPVPGETARRGPRLQPAPRPAPVPDPDETAETLSRIARIVSETLELREVFSRVADAASAILPFDTMGVCRMESHDRLRLYAIVGRTEGEGRAEAEIDPEDAEHHTRLEDFSPALRPSLGRVNRMDDALAALDPRFPMDAELLRLGVRSGLGAPLTSGGRLAGELWFTADRPGAFSAHHERAASAIADIVSLSLEHERLWTLQAMRRQRLDAIDALVPLLAGTLDIREIFARASAIVRPVLAHDHLVLASHSPGGLRPSVEAGAAELLDDLSAPLRETCLARDGGGGAECVLISNLRERSYLGLPLCLDGQARWLLFVSLTPGTYSDEDVIVGRRVADLISLALSHQRLAEEERIASEARERALRLEERERLLRSELEATLGHRRLIGESKNWKDVLSQAANVARTGTTVLLTGESGTGKEVVARFIYRGSLRSSGPFVGLNCAALPETLLESELFGHEKGAFTGATAARPGRIEQAAGGVLFLDEVGEMSPNVQAKLLRVLEEREYQRLGGAQPIKADVRVIAATNRDLEAAIARGEFREDLFYRLSVFEIRLPPLRERAQDIPLLAQTFLDEIGRIVGRRAAGLSRRALEALSSYHWPGNVRELRNALERATIMCDGGLITPEHLPIGLSRKSASRSLADESAFLGDAATALGTGSDVTRIDVAERELIVKALREANDNRSQAARLLGITRSQLYTRLQKYGLA